MDEEIRIFVLDEVYKEEDLNIRKIERRHNLIVANGSYETVSKDKEAF